MSNYMGFIWIPGMGEPGGLPSMGLHRVRHDWSDLAAAAAYGFQVYFYKCTVKDISLLKSLCTIIKIIHFYTNL